MASIYFWGLTASPYQLKMQPIADFAERSWRRFSEQGRPLENLRYPSRVAGMDEYPEVPYYALHNECLYYDSSGLAPALHLDKLCQTAQALDPKSGAERFLCRLINEAFDEFHRQGGLHPEDVFLLKTGSLTELPAM